MVRLGLNPDEDDAVAQANIRETTHKGQKARVPERDCQLGGREGVELRIRELISCQPGLKC